MIIINNNNGLFGMAAKRWINKKYNNLLKIAQKSPIMSVNDTINLFNALINRPLWRRMSLHSATHSYWCMLLLDWTE